MKQLLLGSRSKKNIDKVALIAAEDSECFRELIRLMKDKKEVYLASMAAWAMSHACELNDKLIKGYHSDLIELAGSSDHDAIKRNIVRVWQMIEIPEKYRWDIAEICLKFLGSPLEAVAVKAFSITVLQNLIKHLPEIKEEVVFEIEKQLPHSSAAFKVRSNAFLKSLN